MYFESISENNNLSIKKQGRKKTYDLRITLAIKGAISLCLEYNEELERSQVKV